MQTVKANDGVCLLAGVLCGYERGTGCVEGQAHSERGEQVSQRSVDGMRRGLVSRDTIERHRYFYVGVTFMSERSARWLGTRLR
jgi:hypothetical protein